MKRFIALILLLMMVAATASAAEWEEGFGPNRPYANKPEIDFDKNLGYMLNFPNNAMPVAGTNALYLFLPREDVKLGAGNVTLYSTDLGEEFSASMDDADSVTLRTMTESELVDMVWGSGTCLEILLPVSLRAGTTYYVNMDKDCIMDVARPIGNAAIISTEQTNWFFTTVADYGVSAMEYRRPTGEDTYENKILVPQAGDEVRFDLLIGGNAKSATIVIHKAAQNSIAFEKMLFTESCEVIGHVTGDDPFFDVILWDTEMPPNDREDMYNHVVAWLEF